MKKLVVRALLSGALAGALSAATPIDRMLGEIRDYLLRLPVRDGRLGEHPLLVEADRCEAASPRRVLVLLTYRKLDCQAYPDTLVIAPRLIHPELRERLRRMGFPFRMAPLGYELEHFRRAQQQYRKLKVDLEPPLDQLYGPVSMPRPQENAFAISIRPHDETLVERATWDVARIEQDLLNRIGPMEALRTKRMRKLGPAALARHWHKEIVGELPRYDGDFAAVEQPHSEGASWRAVSITIDALPRVSAHGVLLLPKNLQPGEKRPLIIAQHGLMGSPEVYFGLKPEDKQYNTYRNFGETLVAAGFIVFCPQNPYSGDFRPLQLLANPRGLSLFSFIEAQHRRLLDYLERKPFIDAGRIGYYGLSYGGATAVRVPVFDARFRAIVCGGNFNEWIRKLIDPSLSYSYVHTREYEIYEWGMAEWASHAELAAMAARLHPRPIPFLVERGHQDRVGEDKWVLYELERLKKYVRDPALRQVGFFDGEHRTDGPAAIRFLKESLK